MDITAKMRAILSGEDGRLVAVGLRLALRVPAFFYGLVVRFRNWLYDSGFRAERCVSKPVISIGNITAGGTGKTPAVEYAVRWFAERGARPAVLSRGYGAREGVNDEALLLAAHLPDIPHRQRPDRYLAALEAINVDGANVLVLDDGFQHRRLGRFGDIVLIDATCPFGHGHLIPRGLLREPLKGLRRADVIVITRTDLSTDEALRKLESRLRRLAPGTPIARASHAVRNVRSWPDGAEVDPTELAGRRVGLFCSIGNPGAFRRTVEGLGAVVDWTAEFADHHWYAADDIAAVVGADHRPVEAFVTTEKDAVKLRQLWPAGPKLFVLRVEMQFSEGEEELVKLFEEALLDAAHGKEEAEA